MRPRFEPLTDDRPATAFYEPFAWPPAADVVLRGPVVSLTPSLAADADDLFAALDDDRVWAHVAGRPDAPSNFVDLIAKRRDAGFPWTVRLSRPLMTATGELPAGAVVGITSYLDIAPSDGRLEIGWTAYTPAVWASRVNPATKLLLFAFAFDTLGAGRVQLKTDIRNHRSQQAIHRLGADYEGVLRRYQRRQDGTIRDTVMFGMTVERWPAARAELLARIEP